MITELMLIFLIFNSITLKLKKMRTNNISKALIFLSLILSFTAVNAQETAKLYDPSLDGMKQIKEAADKAARERKHVLIQYGGNWCSWCKKFDAFCKADTSITRIINGNYIPVKLNYDKTNTNDAANSYLGNPARFGFPVFIILDGKGKVIHIQDSSLLEEDSGYSKQKVIGFFEQWTAEALIPKSSKSLQKK
jgi:thioredoxin-related protein